MNFPSARFLAAEGYNVLALAHWGYPGRPDNLAQIELEYFEQAIHWFKNWLGHDRVAFQGASRGGEGTLLVASHYGRQLSGAVSVSPAHLALGAVGPDIAVPSCGAWTLDGEELPYGGTAEDHERVPEEVMRKIMAPAPGEAIAFADSMKPVLSDPAVEARAFIPVERITCPLLLVSGGDDRMWPSTYCANAVMRRLEERGHRHRYEHACYGGAGHNLSVWGGPTFMSTAMLHPAMGMLCALGGTPEANGRAERQSWNRMLSFYREIFNA